MSMSTTVHIRGIQEVQAATLRAAAAAQVSGALGKAVRYATLAAHRYAVAHTVVDTGSWRAAHRVAIHGSSGRIFLDPSAVNPKSGGKPSHYGAFLELSRGGRYAVYGRTVNEAGPQIVQQAGQILEDALP